MAPVRVLIAKRAMIADRSPVCFGNSILRVDLNRKGSESRATLRPGAGTFDVLGVLAVLAWIGFMAALAITTGPPTAETELALSPEDIEAGFREGEEWHGIYLQDQKIGFIRIVRTRAEGEFSIQYSSVLQLTVLGRSQRMEIELDTIVDESFVLRRFTGSLGSDVSLIGMRGSVQELQDGQFRVEYELETAGTIQSGSIDLSQPPTLQSDLRSAVLLRDPEPGATFEHSFFDPLSQQERVVIIEYLGEEPLVVMGERIEAHHLIQYFGEQKLNVWVNDLGEVLREELPLGMIGKRESRAEAMYGVVRTDDDEGGAVDLITVSQIPVSRPPPDVTRVPRLTWRLNGLNADRFDLDGGRQTLAVDSNTIDVQLMREPSDQTYTLETLPIPDDIAAYLEPQSLIQSADPGVIQQTTEVVGEEQRVAAIARLINSWVFETLQKESVVGIPSAVEVLQTRVGDCNEHATLATAMYRSAGVPARIASGVAYMEGSFFYHAWVEYWHDGWRTADPTWGQFPADLGHIRLVSGSLARQSTLVELFGRLRVEFLN